MNEKKITLLNPYEEAEKAGLKSEKKKVNLSDLLSSDNRRPQSLPFWPKAPKDAMETHELARKAHVYGSSGVDKR